MRRGITFTKKAYILLAITGFLNLMAIVFDQLVVQQEDKIRNFDQIVNEQKQEVSNNLYSHKIFKELFFKVQFNASDLITDANYLVRGINYLNSDLPKKINDDQILQLIDTYKEKTKNLVYRFQKTLKDTKFIYYKVINDSAFQNFLKKERDVGHLDEPNYPIKRIENTFKKLSNNGDNDYLLGYNFDAKTAQEQSDNYPIYTNFYSDLKYFNSLKSELGDLSNIYMQEFNSSFGVYYIFLDDYTELKNLKNYLILLSILFQILGLVSLIFLFRTLIVDNK